VVRKAKPSGAQDDKKLQGALKKLNVQPIPGVEEVNMFREDGNVLHFSAPKGGITPLPTLALWGSAPSEKYVTDHMPSNLQSTLLFLPTPLPCMEPDK
jgi:nascent polypeptide-associated complex subunit beta